MFILAVRFADYVKAQTDAAPRLTDPLVEPTLHRFYDVIDEMQNNRKTEFERRCRFPAMLLYDDSITAYDAMEALTLCRTIDIRRGQQGRFARSTLIDSDGHQWQLNGATIVQDVNPLLRWVLFARTVRAAPIITSGPHAADVENIRHEVLRLLTKPHSLTTVVHAFCDVFGPAQTRSIRPEIEKASSPSDIINILLSVPSPERMARLEQV